MKKLIITVALLMVISFAAFAQTSVDEDTVEYQNYQVYKVYAHPDAYVVMYYTKGVELGQVTIPAEWFKPTNRKAILRLVESTNFTPYFTIQTSNGSVTKVILTMTQDRNHTSWGVMDKSIDVMNEGQGNTLYLD